MLINHAWPRATTLKEWSADVLDAHKQLFVYGWGFCDTTSRIAEAAWREYKGDPRAAERVITQHEDGGYRTMYRLRMDNAYGAFDPATATTSSDRDAPGSRPAATTRLLPIRIGLARRGRSEGARFGNGKYRFGTAFHDMSFSLPPGTTITRYWDVRSQLPAHPAVPHDHPDQRRQVKPKVYFENGIMSIPPLFAGAKTVRLHVAGATPLRRNVTVSGQRAGPATLRVRGHDLLD